MDSYGQDTQDVEGQGDHAVREFEVLTDQMGDAKMEQ